MAKKLQVALALGLLLSLLLAAGVQAQTPRPTPTNIPLETPEQGQDDVDRGSIRGTVYRDSNNDGNCGGTGEPALAGIPIRFQSGDTVVYLQSGANGTYGLVAAGLGTWNVTAEPSASQGVVTSAKTVQAVLTEEQQLVLGVDFCIGTADAGPAVLPVSGAPARPGLWLDALAGLAFVAAGAALHVRDYVRRGGKV